MTTSNILIVDGDRSTAQELEDILKTAAYEVVGCVSSLDAAFDQAVYLQPDIVFIRFNLIYDVEAGDPIDEVKRKFDSPVVFVISNLISELSCMAGMDSLCEFVRMPFEIHELHKTIEMIQYRHGMERKLIEFDERTQALLSQIATQTRSTNHTGGEKDKADVLADLLERCYERMELNQVLKIVCEVTTEALGVSAVSILLYDENEDILRLMEDIGLPSEFRFQHKPVPGADYNHLLKQASPEEIILEEEENLYLTNAQLYRALGIKTVIFAEMRVKDRLVGSLNVLFSDMDQQFTCDDLSFLQDLADLAARLIANARELYDNQQMLDHLEMACDAGIVLNSLQDPRVQLESLLQIVMATVGADRLTFYRYECEEDANQEILKSQEYQIQQGALIYENGLGHSPEAIAGLEARRIEVGNEEDFAGWVATNLAALYIADLRADSRFANGDSEIRSVFGVPIERNRDLAGVLLVMSTCDNAFDTKKQILLHRLANLTAVAIKNAKTLSQSRQTLLKQEAKVRILKTLLDARDLNEMVPMYLEELLSVVGATAGGVWVYNTAEEVLVQVARHGLHSYERRIHREDNLLWHIYKHPAVYKSSEFRNDPYVGEKLIELFPVGVGGVVVPMIADKEFVGVCLVGIEQPREMKNDDIDLLIEISNMAGGAIQRMIELEKTKRGLDQARGLQAIDQAISASMDLRFILKIILDQVIRLLRIDAADVLLLNIHTQTLEFTAGQGFYTAALQHTHLKIGQGRAGKAALERRIIHVPNLVEDRNGFQRAPLLSNERFQVYYAIPLVSKGQVMGVLELFHRAEHESDMEWRKFLEAIATQAAIAIDNARLFENLQRTNAELMLAYDTTLEGWSRALELHDRSTPEHTDKVADMATRLARELGVSDFDEIQIRRGAILHDIGKMGIPEDILNKDGPLTEKEWEIMRRHPTYAYDLLSPISYLRPALDIPYCHHERWDGKGYPVGLKGEQIPLAARIFSVIDVWDSMLSDRPYREGLAEDTVLAYIQGNAGTQFDPLAVDAFMNIVQ